MKVSTSWGQGIGGGDGALGGVGVAVHDALLDRREALRVQHPGCEQLLLIRLDRIDCLPGGFLFLGAILIARIAE